ncbi:MAG: exosortase family protein XrtF [Cryomorphaceae bacterium]|nr:exosortase family protein XrtF [Cryomorphaceae bacterium]
MSENQLNNFKPTIFFLLRFGLIYGIGSIIYAFYIAHHDPKPDPFTDIIATQLAGALRISGSDISLTEIPDEPLVQVIFNGNYNVSIFEGCNGIAVMILFMAFVVAFRGWNNPKALWFIPMGIVAIHLWNLLRLSLLIHINEKYDNLFHFYHKYFFTAIIYLFVLLLWVIWVNMQKSSTEKTPA